MFEEFQKADPAAWALWVQNNANDAYGIGTLEYAARWAAGMDADLADGMKLEDIASRTSHEADTEGITGFMYSMAVGVLAKCWVHGEALRRWHNHEHQIGTEGDAANESGRVLNTALLNIG